MGPFRWWSEDKLEHQPSLPYAYLRPLRLNSTAPWVFQPTIRCNWKHSRFLDMNVLSLNIVFYTKIFRLYYIIYYGTAPPIPTSICWFFCCLPSPGPLNTQLLPRCLSSCSIKSLWLITERIVFPFGLGNLNGCVK